MRLGANPRSAPLGARCLERVACRSLKPLERLTLIATNQAKIGEGSHRAGAPVDYHVAPRHLFHADTFVAVQEFPKGRHSERREEALSRM